MASEERVPLEVEAKSADVLFDDRAEPTYPHTTRLMNPKLALYLEGLARELRGDPRVEIRIRLDSPSLVPGEEERIAKQIRTYFAEEQRLADLDLRVNQREGWGFFRRGFPLILVALLVAGIFYVAQPSVPSATLGTFLTALVYLVFITIVWVLLWDPIEKLLFDAYLLRSRVRALGNLGSASVRFAYGPATRTAA